MYLFRIDYICAKFVQLFNGALCHLSFEFPTRDGGNDNSVEGQHFYVSPSFF